MGAFYNGGAGVNIVTSTRRDPPESKVIVLSTAQFRALPDYSCTIPTGTTPGLRWRRREPYQTGPGIFHRHFMGEYREYPPDHKRHKTHIRIVWKRIVIAERQLMAELVEKVFPS